MNALFERFTPTSLVRFGTILFMASIVFAYSLYPHWLTLSHFATHWYTLIPFALAMLIAVLELWYLGGKFKQALRLSIGGTILRASAICAALVVCIPYTTNKALHNIVALLFVLLAAFAFAAIAKKLRTHILGILSVALVIICALELVFLARYNTHPVYPWVWVVLELAATALLVAGLYIIAMILEQRTKPPKAKDYESMTNPQLLTEARRKGMMVTPIWNNRLSVIRMVQDDRIDEADRQAFIERLRSFDSQRSARMSMAIAVLSLIVAVASLCVSVLLGLN